MILHQWLLYFHILAAITWMGAGITLVLLGIRSQQTQSELKIIDQMQWIGPRIGGPCVLTTLITGIGMVHGDALWSFKDFWVLGGLIALVLLFLIGIGYHMPHYKRIHKAVDEKGKDSPEVKKLIGQSFAAAQLEVIILAVVVLLMVSKTGMGKLL